MGCTAAAIEAWKVCNDGSALESSRTTSSRSAAAWPCNGPEVPTATTRNANGSSGRNQNVHAESDGLFKRIAHSERAILRRKVARAGKELEKLSSGSPLSADRCTRCTDCWDYS